MPQASRFPACIFLIAGLFSCKSESEPVKPAPEKLVAQKISRLNCLSENIDLCQLLNQDSIFQLIAQDSTDKEIGQIDSITYERTLVDNLPQLNACSFEWPGNRMDTLFGDNWKLPYQVTNELGVGEVQFFGTQADADVKAQKAFNRFYRNIDQTEADSIRSKMMMDSVFVSDSTYQDINLELGYTQRYEPLEAIGERAVWDRLSRKLVVLESGIIFKVMADVYSDEEKNKHLSIEIAKQVLNHCR